MNVKKAKVIFSKEGLKFLNPKDKVNIEILKDGSMVFERI